MGKTYKGDSKKIRAYIGASPIRMYRGNERIFPNAGNVIYYVDADKVYNEEIDIDESILNPKTFSPQKDGYTFHGWRKDSVASGTVLSNEIMTGENVVLYAVFKQNVTASYSGNGSTGGSTSGETKQRYYNNGNIANPSFVLKTNGFTKTYYKFTKWAKGGVGGTQYSEGETVSLDTSVTFYALWTAKTLSKTITRNVVTAINNWEYVRTLVLYDGNIFASPPSILLSGEKPASVIAAHKTYAIIKPDNGASGGSWNVTANISGEAYESAAASGIGYATGEFPISISNWKGGSRDISFGRTFKKPPRMDWYSPNPSSEALQGVNWTIEFTNITTTGCTVTWGKSTGNETRDFGWIAEGEV